MLVKNKSGNKIVLKDFKPHIILLPGRVADLSRHWTTKQIADSKDLDKELAGTNVVGVTDRAGASELALKHSRNIAGGWKGTALREYEFPVLGGLVQGGASQKLTALGLPGVAFSTASTGSLHLINGTPNDHVLGTGGKLRLYCSYSVAIPGLNSGVRLVGTCHFGQVGRALGALTSTNQTLDLSTQGPV